jgi:hypothetical protein
MKNNNPIAVIVLKVMAQIKWTKLPGGEQIDPKLGFAKNLLA